MSNFVCELCGGTQFAKSNGLFVCQCCGVNYTTEELRKLMNGETQSAPVQTIPVQPTPAQPTPVQPTPAQPTPVQPTPAQPTPAQPAPAQPTPAQPTPAQPTPVQPTPVQPTPAQPTPVQPTPVQSAPVQTASAQPAAVQPTTSPKKSSAKQQKKKKIPFKYIVLGAAVLLALIVFISSLISAMDVTSTSGNTALIVSGIFELLIAFILYKVMIHIERYRCPACATKREHHRAYLYTSDVDKTFSNQGGDCEKTIYTHHYEDTYVCPACGETRTEQVKKSGGEYLILGNGQVRDTRKPPKEF